MTETADVQKMLKCRGMRFPLDRAILPPRIRTLLREGAYEAKEATAVRKLVKADDVVMELGAGIGFMSTLVATKTPAKSVHSFEANPQLMPYIAQVHAENNVTNAHVTNAVLGDQDGTAPFYIRKNFLASSLDPMEDAEDCTKVEVPTRNVNAVIKELQPSVLICDIEGAEADLLPKMDLTGLRAVVIETHPQWIGKAGMQKVFRCMDAAGLVFFPRWSHGKVAVFRSDW
ncbi:FkbM family methyltransferase [Pseudophaeobacter sp. TrK17]|jgi:FkbM family methyltransferase|uniref:FkbM family methyltransferase n=1 Tax=Pseudophaeobacter sp. TrK17 TaxID=2815167 RepID=UPI00220A3FB7|nr:FkbM family methyltransferase [Phaeobacter sp. G2]